MTIQEERALRIQFEKQHNPRLTDAEAQTAAFQADPDFYWRHRHAQTHGQAQPPTVRKQHRVSYEQALADVDTVVRKAASRTRQDAWVIVLKAHEGQADQRDYEAALRRWQTQAETVQKQAPADWQPDPHDYLRLKHG
jgi:hypothetical protein